MMLMSNIDMCLTPMYVVEHRHMSDTLSIRSGATKIGLS